MTWDQLARLSLKAKGWESGSTLVMKKQFAVMGREGDGSERDDPLKAAEVYVAASKRRQAYLAEGVRPDRIKMHPDDAILGPPDPPPALPPDPFPLGSVGSGEVEPMGQAVESAEEKEARHLRYRREYGDIFSGCPVGDDAYVEAFMATTLEELQGEFDVLYSYHDDPQQFAVFLSMVFPAKIMHFMRGLAPRHSKPLAEAFTTLQRQAVCKLAGVDKISDISFAIAQQGTGSGGAGLKDMMLTPEPAYVASFLSSLPVLVAKIPDLVERLLIADETSESTGLRSADDFLEALWQLEYETTDDWGNSEWNLEELLKLDEGGLKHLQKKLTGHRKLAKRMANEEALKPDFAGHAHYLGGTQGSAGAFMRAVPTTRSTTIPPLLFKQAFRNRCLIPHPNIDPNELTCTICPLKNASSKGKVDTRGHHLCKCKALNYLAIQTHDTVKDDLIRFMESCGLSVRGEPKDALLLAGLGDRGVPDFVVRHPGHRQVAYDLRITSNVARAQEKGEKASTPGAQIAKSESDKRALYLERCNDNGLDFEPLVFLSQGNRSDTTNRVLEAIIATHSKRTKIPQATIRQHLDVVISVGLQESIARAQLTRAELIIVRREAPCAANMRFLAGIAEDAANTREEYAESGYARVATMPLGGGGGRTGSGPGGGMGHA